MDTWMTLFSVALGGLIGISGNLFDRFWQRRNRIRGAAASIAAEIESTIEMTSTRRYFESYTGWLEAWKRGERRGERPNPIADVPPREAFPVIYANLQVVGDLGPDLARDITKFYNMTSSIRLDLIDIGKPTSDISFCIQAVEEDLKLWAQAEALGRDLVKRLAGS